MKTTSLAALVAFAAGLLTLSGCAQPDGTGEPPAPRPAAKSSSAHQQLAAAFPEHAPEVVGRGAGFEVSKEALVARTGAAHGLALELPGEGKGAIILRSEREGELPHEVRVHEVSAAGAAEIAEAAVAYRAEHGRAFWTSDEGGAEEWLHLDPGVAYAGKVAARWEIDGGVAVDRDGTIEIEEAGGVSEPKPGWLRVTAPRAFAKGGRPVTARLFARNGGVELEVDAAGEEALVDPLWNLTGNMSVGRFWHTGSWLAASAQVLIAGGYPPGGSVPLASTELFSRANGTFSTGPALAAPRVLHTATTLADGRVLVAGGITSNSTHLGTSELLDPTTMKWGAPATMIEARQAHTTVYLPAQNKVLACGGQNAAGTAVASCELYDPTQNTWKAAASMTVIRYDHAAITLPSGKVLVTGGRTTDSVATCEIYDPVANTWKAAGGLSHARSGHSIGQLSATTVIVASGVQWIGNSGSSQLTAELYDIANDKWSDSGNFVNARTGVPILVLASGHVLAPGGYPQVAGADFYDPVTGFWTSARTLNVGRGFHTATDLQDGTVLVAGGLNPDALASAEIYSPSGNGSACTFDADCTSAHCADGVCCDTACTGTCQACTAAKKGGGKDGACGNVAVATDPDNECAAQAQSTCGTNGFCDGKGACQLYAAATQCVAASCKDPTTVTAASLCDGNGKCVTGGSTSCGNYQCATGACKTSCAADTDCASTAYCAGAACTPKKVQGATCTASDQCSSGSCVDGFCCDTACTGLCQACSAAKKGAGADGTCGNVNASTDPDNECTAQATSTCGTNGFCDGKGACALYAAATQCAAASCKDATTATAASLCDGNGKCVTGGSTSCGAYVCTTGACKTACMADADCSTGNYCSGSKCVPQLPIASACTASDQCGSGACSDGVCCDQACTGTCMSCSKAKKGGGTDGKCEAVLAGNDPDDECPTTTADTCGTTGACDGKGACQLYDKTTVCSPAACNGTTVSLAKLCDGTGKCAAGGGTEACDPFPCVSGECSSACTVDDDCSASGFCDDGTSTCVTKLPTGQACTIASHCSTGFCVDGVCCDAACSDGQCQACAMATGATADGACTPLSGTACSDGDGCTQNDTCQKGVCVPGSTVTCDQSNLCEETSTCDSTTGACSHVPKALDCSATSSCNLDGACDPGTGACVRPSKLDGTDCEDDGQKGACVAGKCVPDPTLQDGGTKTTSGTGGGAGVGGAGGAGGSSSHPTTTNATGSGGAAASGNPTLIGGACSVSPPSSTPAPWPLGAAAVALALTLTRRRRTP